MHDFRFFQINAYRIWQKFPGDSEVPGRISPGNMSRIITEWSHEKSYLCYRTHSDQAEHNSYEIESGFARTGVRTQMVIHSELGK